MARKNKKLNRFISRHSRLLLLAAVLAIGVGAWLVMRSPSSVPSAAVSKDAKNIAAAKSTAIKNAPTSTKSSTSSLSGSQGAAVSENGAHIPSTPSSSWATSSGSKIVLHSPIANSTFSSGGIIGGTARVSTVQYALTDDSVGIIAQGSLPVKDGKFSGAVSFTPHAKTGKLDVFSSSCQFCARQNLIEITLSYNF